ncbi:MAG: glycosyltransferase family 1 protein [Nitrospiraceae bacterium]|nr:MAG: glycosyltransferase family 1 protein [Nitrospiraceae bacterium]
MKILLVSNFYYNRGGDCTYLFYLKKLLEKRGHNVIIFSMNHPQNFDSEYSRHFVSYINYDEEVKSKTIASVFKVLNRTIYSNEARRRIEELILDEKPDIAHLQNIHHHITPSVFYALKKNNIPIVWTLHDYTVICPNTSFLSHGKVCEKCRKSKYYWPLILRCKKNSFGASAMAAFETMIHMKMGVNDLVDIFIAPSSFLENKLIDYGFDRAKIRHLTNFMTDISVSDAENKISGTSDYYLYIGRVSEEKGIKTLIDAASKIDSCKLKIVGTGPLEEEMVSYAESKNGINNIEFLGYRKHEEVLSLLRGCRFVVLPSEWYENYPYSVLEAFSYGKPVIGSRIGGIPEIVKNWETGLLFDPGDSEDLSLKIRFLINHPDKAEMLGRNARRFIDEEINADKHYDDLMSIYSFVLQKTMAEKQGAQGPGKFHKKDRKV